MSCKTIGKSLLLLSGMFFSEAVMRLLIPPKEHTVFV